MGGSHGRLAAIPRSATQADVQGGKQEGWRGDGAEAASDRTATIRIRSLHAALPTQVELAHLTPGQALGFDSQIEIQYIDGVAGKIVTADGFAPLVSQ